MDHVPAVLTGLASVAALLALVAAGAVYFRQSFARATITTLQESNGALNEQVKILKDQRLEDERERAADRARIASLEAARAALERENSTLMEVVQGKADIERVIQVMQDQFHSEVQDRDAWRTTWAGRMDSQDQALHQIKGMLGSTRTTPRGSQT